VCSSAGYFSEGTGGDSEGNEGVDATGSSEGWVNGLSGQRLTLRSYESDHSARSSVERRVGKDSVAVDWIVVR